MIAVRIKVDTSVARKRLMKLKHALSEQGMDPVVEKVTQETLVELKRDTPVRWTGELREGWAVVLRTKTQRKIDQKTEGGSRIMRWLEVGTANGGRGRIYPRVKKFLFIPLRKAAANGWHAGLKIGRDYILRRSVRGITPRWIVLRARARALVALTKAVNAHIRQALS